MSTVFTRETTRKHFKLLAWGFLNYEPFNFGSRPSCRRIFHGIISSVNPLLGTSTETYWQRENKRRKKPHILTYDHHSITGSLVRFKSGHVIFWISSFYTSNGYTRISSRPPTSLSTRQFASSGFRQIHSFRSRGQFRLNCPTRKPRSPSKPRTRTFQGLYWDLNPLIALSLAAGYPYCLSISFGVVMLAHTN